MRKVIATLILLVISIASLSFLPLLHHKQVTATTESENKVSLTLHNSTFIPLTNVNASQVGVFVNYKLHDDSLVGKEINAVMKLYASNGTLIRTSSYPNGFAAVSSGGIEGLKTTINDNTIQSVDANVSFTDQNKTNIISNVITVNLPFNTTSKASEDNTTSKASEDNTTSKASEDNTTSKASEIKQDLNPFN